MTMDIARPAGTAYIMTNAAEGNTITAYRRAEDGSLSLMNMYTTGGAGSGPRGVSPAPGNGVDPLMSQGSLALSGDGRLLFAVNAGSNSLSSFRVSQHGSLTLVGTATAGIHPVCLCSRGGLLYAAHAGNSADNFSSGVWGYTVGSDGRLVVIPGSGRPLSMQGSHPAGAALSPDGRFLVVSELNNDRLSVFVVGRGGILSGPVVSASNGRGPFGSLFFSNELLLVAEATANALTSYRLSSDFLLSVASTARSGQMATCWVAVTPDERFAYTSNAVSGTVTLYSISSNGNLMALASTPTITGGAMGAPIDIGVSRDGRNLYALNGNQGSVSAFSIGAGGRLTLLHVLTRAGLPALGAQGIAVL